MKENAWGDKEGGRRAGDKGHLNNTRRPRGQDETNTVNHRRMPFGQNVVLNGPKDTRNAKGAKVSRFTYAIRKAETQSK